MKKAQNGKTIKKVTGDKDYDSLLSKRDSFLTYNSYKAWNDYLQRNIQAIKDKRSDETNKKAGIIKDNKGYWNPKNKGKVVQIGSNKITMLGVDQPLIGISDEGDTKLMQPGQDYNFEGNTVTEYPIMAKSGIHINPKNKGKFNATKKATGKTTEQLTHSKNPVTKKRAIFAQNAAKWNKGQMGFSMDEIAPDGQIDLQPIDQNSGIYNPYGNQQQAMSLGNYSNSGTSFLKKAGSFLDSNVDNINMGLGAVEGIAKGVSLLKQEKQQKQSAEQFSELSKVVKQSSGTRPEKVKRKYVRPEDQILDPNTVFPTYGTGTNYLAKNGKSMKKAQFGEFLNNGGGNLINSVAQIGGNALGGGNGFNQSGGTQIGGAIGGAAGSLLGPVGSILGKAAGSLIGGALDQNARKIKKFNKIGTQNLQGAAFQQGAENLQNQYTGFMRTGGNLKVNTHYNIGGEVKTHWGGEAETASVNPYLPFTGETLEFKGNSHEKGGIGMTFGKNPVEVEGGEPAVKLKNGGKGGNLTVFGDMKIPEYGVAEIGDKNAKGKKFKNYINSLNDIENKQNKVVNKGVNLVNTSNPNIAYDKLTMNSGKLLMLGGNMKLKDVANKKEISSIVQNAILDTAEEMNVNPSKLAEGKIKKAKKGMSLPSYQEGGEASMLDPISALKKLLGKDVSVKEVKRAEEQGLLKQGFNPLKEIPGILKKQGQSAVEPLVPKAVGGGDNKPDEGWYSTIKGLLNKGASYEELAGKGHGTAQGLRDLFPNEYNPISSPDEYARLIDDNGFGVNARANYELGSIPNEHNGIDPHTPINTPSKGKFNWASTVNSILPLIRPTNQQPLDPNQLMGEMYALSNNQVDPVQAQRYNPLLEQPYDISLQDQLNANQADFNSITRLTQNNPAANSILAGQKYAANSGVLGEQFRQNQANKAGVYNRNRGTLNDAQLKNLGIMDQQYVRQAQAKSNTKAVTQQAVNSISDKIAQYKRDQTILNIDQNMYNYRFGKNGKAWNWNGLLDVDAIFNKAKSATLDEVDEKGNITKKYQTSDRYNKNRLFEGTTKTESTTVRPKGKNGILVKGMKGANLKSYC